MAQSLVRMEDGRSRIAGAGAPTLIRITAEQGILKEPLPGAGEIYRFQLSQTVLDGCSYCDS